MTALGVIFILLMACCSTAALVASVHLFTYTERAFWVGMSTLIAIWGIATWAVIAILESAR